MVTLLYRIAVKRDERRKRNVFECVDKVIEVFFYGLST